MHWPFSRSVQAKVIDRLTAAGAKVIAEDIQYTERTAPMPGCGAPCVQLAEDEDAALAVSVYNAGQKGSKVVLSTTEVADRREHERPRRQPRACSAPGRRNGSFPRESDGVIRRFPAEIDKLETFPVVAAERALGHALDPSAFPEKRMWINFAGPPGRVPFLSFSQVSDGKFDPAAVRGKIVVVGATAPVLQDVHADLDLGRGHDVGPGDPGERDRDRARRLPAPERADVAERARRSASWRWSPAILGLRLSAAWTIVSSILLGAVYAVVTQVAFNHGTILAFVYPMVALVDLDGRRARRALRARGLRPAAHARHLSRGSFRMRSSTRCSRKTARLQLGGVRVVGTCMFADLRGSTQFAESLPPETVVDGHQPLPGRADRGDPRKRRHADLLPRRRLHGRLRRADRAGRSRRPRLRARHARSSASGCRCSTSGCVSRDYGEHFRIGVGINTGPFMAGNVGSEKRLEYTAMGDTINTASRLEGSTKESDFYFLIADSTREALVEPRRRRRRGRRGRRPRPPGAGSRSGRSRPHGSRNARHRARRQWAHLGLNQGPLACEASALPLSYAPGSRQG